LALLRQRIVAAISHEREPRRFTIRCAMWSKAVFHTSVLMGALYEEIIQTFLLAELIAPPTMTDETEPTIAGVTSLHEFPRGW